MMALDTIAASFEQFRSAGPHAVRHITRIPVTTDWSLT